MAIGGAFVLILLVWLGMAVGVGIHASERDRSEALWGLLVLITGVLGIAIYAVALASSDPHSASDDQPERQVGEQINCGECGARNVASANYCQNCGGEL